MFEKYSKFCGRSLEDNCETPVLQDLITGWGHLVFSYCCSILPHISGLDDYFTVLCQKSQVDLIQVRVLCFFWTL